MSLSMITLPTNKSQSVVDDDRRVIRQSEKGLKLSFTILDADGSAYDLTGKDLVFSETKTGGKVVIDDGKGPESGVFTIDDAKAGKFSYTLQSQVYVESGVCWIEILEGSSVVDTTKDFYFDVKKDATINPTNDSYVSRMVALEATLDAAATRATDTLNQLSSQYSDYQKKYNALDSEWQAKQKSIQADADQHMATIDANATKQINDFKSQVSQVKTFWQTQSSQIDADYKKQIADAIKDVQSKRDAAIADVASSRDTAIAQANKEFNDKLTNLQKDYDTWKVKTVADFNATVDPIKKQIEGNAQNLDSVNKKLDETNQAIAKAEKDFASVNFNDFVKSTDVYSKSEIDAKVVAAGKVKTVNKIQPDASGNISIPQPDLSPYAKTADVNNLINQINGSRLPVYIGKSTDDLFSFKTSQIRKYAGGSGIKNNPFDASVWFTAIYLTEDNAGGGNVVAMDTKGNIYNCGLNSGTYGKWTKISNQTDLNNLQTTLHNSINGKADKSTTYTKTDIDNKVSTINSSLNTKASKTDVSNLQNKLTAVETTANEAKTAASNVKTFIPISQADYDKLTDDQKKNGWYAIG